MIQVKCEKNYTCRKCTLQNMTRHWLAKNGILIPIYPFIIKPCVIHILISPDHRKPIFFGIFGHKKKNWVTFFLAN